MVQALQRRKADLAYLRERARQENAPRIVTTAQLEEGMNSGKLREFRYTILLWKKCVLIDVARICRAN
jgi:hypothetical protein